MVAKEIYLKVLATLSVLLVTACGRVSTQSVPKVESELCPIAIPATLDKEWFENRKSTSFVDLTAWAKDYIQISHQLGQCYAVVQKWESEFRYCRDRK